jgi:hypothetical protein
MCKTAITRCVEGIAKVLTPGGGYRNAAHRQALKIGPRGGGSPAGAITTRDDLSVMFDK